MIRAVLLAFILFLALVAAGAHAEVAGPDTSRGDFIEVETDLPLRGLYLVPDPRAGEFQVDLFVIAGEYDATGPQGLAHFLEHVVYLGAERRRPGASAHPPEGTAFAGGALTSYHKTVRRDRLPVALAFMARVLEPPEIPPRFARSEKQIILQEYNGTMGAQPARRALQSAHRVLVGGSPVGRSTSGTPREIRAVSLEDARAFHRRFYGLSNVALVVRGPTDADALRAAVETALADAPAGRANPQAWRRTAPPAAGGRVIGRLRLDDHTAGNDHVQVLSLSRWPGTGSPLRDRMTRGFATILLRSALPGSLRKPLEFDAFITDGLSFAITSPFETHAEAIFRADVEPGVDMASAIDAYRTALRASARRGVSEAVMERLRARLLRSQRQIGSDPQLILAEMRTALAAGDRPRDTRARLAAIEAVTREDVEALLEALARPERVVAVELRGRR